MNALALFLAGAIPSFAAGLWARPYVDGFREKLIEEGHRMKPQPDREQFVRWLPLILALTTVVSCAALAFTVESRRSSQAENTYLTRCLSSLLRESSTVSANRAQAVAKRDDALLELVRLRVTLGLDNNNKDVRKAVEKFVRRSAELDAVRMVSPIPSFEDYCRSKVAR